MSVRKALSEFIADPDLVTGLILLWSAITTLFAERISRIDTITWMEYVLFVTVFLMLVLMILVRLVDRKVNVMIKIQLANDTPMGWSQKRTDEKLKQPIID